VYTIIHLMRIQRNDRKLQQQQKYLENINMIEQFQVEDNSDGK
jgi:hypothetical protein